MLALALIAGGLLAPGAKAQAPVTRANGSLHGGSFVVPIHQSQVLRLEVPFVDVLVGNAEIADVLPLTDRSIYVLGKGLGTTRLTLYEQNRRLIAVVDLVVTYDIEGLKGRLNELMPGERIEIRPANDALVLSGAVSNATRLAQALAVAERYAPGKVTNLLAVNAACCTFERLVQIFRGKVTLRRLLPHVMHLAFLGVVLSHLASSIYGDRNPGIAVPEGGFEPVGRTGWVLKLDRLDLVMGAEGTPKDVSAAVTLYRDVTPVAKGVVRTNEPLFHEGYGVYLKNFGPTPWGAPYAVFDANRDPGAVAVLVSSVLFTVANLLYLVPARRENA